MWFGSVNKTIQILVTISIIFIYDFYIQTPFNIYRTYHQTQSCNDTHICIYTMHKKNTKNCSLH